MGKKENQFSLVLAIVDMETNKAKYLRVFDKKSKTCKDYSEDEVYRFLDSGKKMDNVEMIEYKIVYKKVPAIPFLKDKSASLKNVCSRKGNLGKQILKEFTYGKNFPVSADEIAFDSEQKFRFRCLKCGRTVCISPLERIGCIGLNCGICITNLLDYCRKTDREFLIDAWSPKNPPMYAYNWNSKDKAVWVFDGKEVVEHIDKVLEKAV